MKKLVKRLLDCRDKRLAEKQAGLEGIDAASGLVLIYPGKPGQQQQDNKFYSNTPLKCWLVPLKQQSTGDPYQTLVQNGDRGR